METWGANNWKFAAPRAVFVLSMAGSHFSHPAIKEVNVVGDLGHHDDLLYGKKTHKFSGAAAAILTLAMIAYCDESDFIYKEQDALAFGSWGDKMYEEIGDAGCLLGPNVPCPSGTALILMRHWAIPEIVGKYLLSRPEHDSSSLVEHHFHDLAKENPSLFKYHTFGYDKRRPYNLDDKVFWLQQPNESDLEKLEQKGLL